METLNIADIRKGDKFFEDCVGEFEAIEDASYDSYHHGWKVKGKWLLNKLSAKDEVVDFFKSDGNHGYGPLLYRL